MTEPDGSADGRPGEISTRQLAKGSLWTILSRWGLRFVGVISTLILARLLTPEDFGLVAMATLAAGLLQVFSETGQRLALIRIHVVERAHYDTAWTMGMIVGAIVAVAMVAVAPLAAAYFNEPKVELIMYVLAIRPVFLNLENIGTVDFRRDMQFDREFTFIMIPKIVSFVLTVVFSFVLMDYRALVIGILANQVATVGLSYLMHPYRPRFSLARFHELFGFSTWSLAAGLGNYAAEKTDEAIIGRLYPTADLGVYTVTASVAAMPVEELTAPASRALYSGFSRARDDLRALRSTYLDAMSVLFPLAMASSIGLAAVAHDAVLVLLGEKWLAGVPYVPWLAMAAAVLGLSRTDNAMLTAIGRVELVAVRQWLFVFCLVGAMLAGNQVAGLLGIAAARFIAIFAIWLVFVATLVRAIRLSPWQLAAVAWRPAVAALAMYASVDHAAGMGIANPVARLGAMIALGGGVFCAVHLVTWLVSGRPRGIEEFARVFLTEQWRRRRPKARKTP